MKKYIRIIPFLLIILTFAIGCDHEEDLTNHKIEALRLDKKQAFMNVGEELLFFTKTNPENVFTNNIIWNIENTDIATVTGDGKVMAKKEGETILTASFDGLTTQAKIIVYNETFQARNYDPEYDMNGLFYLKFDATEQEIDQAEKIRSRVFIHNMGNNYTQYDKMYDLKFDTIVTTIYANRLLYSRNAKDDILVSVKSLIDTKPMAEVRSYLNNLLANYGMKKLPSTTINESHLKKCYSVDKIKNIEVYEGVDLFEDILFIIHDYSFFMDNYECVAIEAILKEDIIK